VRFRAPLQPTAGWKTVPAYSIAKDEPYYLNMGLTAEAVAAEYSNEQRRRYGCYV
jgi:hypothetical protein